MIKSIIAGCVLAAAAVGGALAQSQPPSGSWSHGFVPTPAQWQAAWASKQDYGAAITTPVITGGNGAGSTLTLRSTSSTGTADALIFQTGSQTERMEINSAGQILMGPDGTTAESSPDIGTEVGVIITGVNDPGSHPDVKHSAQLIVSEPVGSGKNGPLSTDTALSIYQTKLHFEDDRTLSHFGEIDGIYVQVRNTGPTDGTVGPNRSDSCGVCINAYNWGLTGFITANEYVVGNFDNIGIAKDMDIQIGSVNADTIDPYANGMFVSATTGSLDNAFFVSAQNSATWMYGFRATSTSINVNGYFISFDDTFVIDSVGDVTIFGYLQTRNGALTLANGLNSDIVVTTSYSRISGPSGSFSVGGFKTPVNGEHLTIYNSTAQQMTVVNEDASSTATNRIKTLTGSNVILRAGTSAANFIYDSTDGRWVLTGTN